MVVFDCVDASSIESLVLPTLTVKNSLDVKHLPVLQGTYNKFD